MVTSSLALMKKTELEILEDFNNQNKADEDKHYAENADLSSLASYSSFKLIYLDELDKKSDSSHEFTNKFLKQRNSSPYKSQQHLND